MAKNLRIVGLTLPSFVMGWCAKSLSGVKGEGRRRPLKLKAVGWGSVQEATKEVQAITASEQRSIARTGRAKLSTQKCETERDGRHGGV
jgi:hypothetical protein